ncbi:MAG: tRNA (adenosine(37)-N6)-threonylcarbamoyltransferase complex ATPase subunit type 1 TsaE [bacterium]
MDLYSYSESDTIKFAQEVSKAVKGGDVLLLSGELGAGKTSFSKALAFALGIEEVVTSPTFVILKKYRLPVAQNHIKELVHTDCYRLTTLADAESIGLAEYLAQDDLVILIEWPENIASIIPERAKKINFEYIDENTRKITHNFKF